MRLFAITLLTGACLTLVHAQDSAKDFAVKADPAQYPGAVCERRDALLRNGELIYDP